MGNENPPFNSERRVALKKEDLPPLRDGYVRVVHLTSKNAAEEILKTGLNYKRHGMLQSTARAWSNEKDAEFSTTDPRFQGEHMVAVVFDIPFEEHRLYENITKSPGIVPPEHIVGIIPSK